MCDMTEAARRGGFSVSINPAPVIPRSEATWESASFQAETCEKRRICTF